MAVTPQQEISNTLNYSPKFPLEYLTFTFGEIPFAFGEIMFDFGGDSVHFSGSGPGVGKILLGPQASKCKTQTSAGKFWPKKFSFMSFFLLK